MKPVLKLDRARWQLWVTVVVLVAAVGFTFMQLHPGLLFANTTPAGGDMGAHVWTPAYLRDHLLPHGRLTGWAPDWYGGFPALTFYFPLPSLMIVLADLVMPYNVAFKLISVSGLLTLPIATWFFARCLKLKFPGPLLVALATVPFMFDRSFTIYGGNIASTLAGEFAMSISLTFCLVYLGLFAKVLETGKYKALTAATLACVGISHIVPSIIAIAGSLVLLAMVPRKESLKRAFPVFVVAGLIAAFWVLPFVARLAYTNDMGWEKLTHYREELGFKTKLNEAHSWIKPSGQETLLFAMAFLGLVLAFGRRSKAGLFAAAMAFVSLLGFIYAPQSRLWNARLLPSWFFFLYVLAGVGIGELALGASWLLNSLKRAILGDGREDESFAALEFLPRLLAPLFGLAFTLVVVGMPLGQLPTWWPQKTTDHSFIIDWGAWNYSGYERKAAYPEYRDVITTMESVGKDHGCGRAMWEYEPELDRMGTPMALMLLPYWTDGCIDSMEGLFFESAASTPYHFLNQSELSAVPSRPQRDLPYGELNVADGVRHLQQLGVKYYMAISTTAIAQADLVPDLKLVGETKPWSATVNANGTSSVENRSWKIYMVKDSALVAPLDYLPAVMTNVPKGGREWLDAAVDSYTAEGDRDVLFAASGPSAWPRVSRPSDTPPKKSIARPARVSRITSSDDRISFDVDRVGVPVVVKSSYFPNWQAKGAEGPYRVTPNLMVVVPTSKHVSLHYGVTPVDLFANALSLLGLLGLGGLWWWGRRPQPPTTEPAEPESSTKDEKPVEEASSNDDENDWLRELAGVGGLGT